MDFILKRLGEPSTWAGLAAVIVGLNGLVPDAQQWADTVTTVGVAVCGIVAIWRREAGGN